MLWLMTINLTISTSFHDPSEKQNKQGFPVNKTQTLLEKNKTQVVFIFASFDQ